jgi:hypothetical protein
MIRAPRPGALILQFIASLNRPANSVRRINVIELGSVHGSKFDVSCRDGVTTLKPRLYRDAEWAAEILAFNTLAAVQGAFTLARANTIARLMR